MIMAIQQSKSFIHWNYFLALESDLAQISRYIEFDKKNFKTYSIELAHLLLASSSEVDVIAKNICGIVEPNSPANTINHYRKIINRKLPNFKKEQVYFPRFNLTLKPWSNWSLVKNPKNPLWWRSYNKVKHERSEHFSDANLKNVLNAMGGLLVAAFHFYKLKFNFEGLHISDKDVTRRLGAGLGFMKLQDNYYGGSLLLDG
jgi:hypothetical protein